jgi:hypothetical protein
MPSVTQPFDLRYGSNQAVFVCTERRMHLTDLSEAPTRPTPGRQRIIS